MNDLVKAEDVASKKANQPDEREKRQRVCQGCGYIFRQAEYYPCPQCDTGAPDRREQDMDHNAGVLNRVGKKAPIDHGGKHSWEDVCTIVEQRYRRVSDVKKSRVAYAVYCDLNKSKPPWGAGYQGNKRRTPHPATVVAFDESQRAYKNRNRGGTE